MIWTMPRPIVQGVAALLALTAAGSFAMGIIHAPDRGRLPGERVPGAKAGVVAPIEATEATPLSQERIEGPPPPAKVAKADEDTNTEEDAADQADQPTAAGPKSTNAVQITLPPAVSTNSSVPPPLPQEEPPH